MLYQSRPLVAPHSYSVQPATLQRAKDADPCHTPRWLAAGELRCSARHQQCPSLSLCMDAPRGDPVVDPPSCILHADAHDPVRMLKTGIERVLRHSQLHANRALLCDDISVPSSAP